MNSEKKNILVLQSRKELGLVDIACRLVQLDKEVYVVKDGFQALERLQSHRVDLIIAHDQMQEMDSLTFLRELTPEMRRKVIYLCFQVDRASLRKLGDLGLYEIMVQGISPVRVAISAIEFFVFEREDTHWEDGMLAAEATDSSRCQYDNPFY